MPVDKKVILITGASSGIGLHSALQLAVKEHIVYATMRDLAKKTEVDAKAKETKVALKYAQLDVTDPSSIQNAVNSILDAEKRIDVLINNAGFGQMGALEKVSIAEHKKQLDVNYLGTIRCIQAVLPTMRKQKSGTIVNVTSVAGFIGFPLGTAYGASKFAVEGLSEGLAIELAPWNIKVRLVEPGPVATQFNDSAAWGTKPIPGGEDPYKEQHDAMIKQFQVMDEQSSTQEPSEAAKAVVDASLSKEPFFRFQTSDWVAEMAKKKLAEPLELVTS